MRKAIGWLLYVGVILLVASNALGLAWALGQQIAYLCLLIAGGGLYLVLSKDDGSGDQF